MQKRLVNFLRLLGFSLSAVAVSACMRIPPPGLTAEAPPEPRFTDAPAAEVAPQFFENVAEDERMAALEARLDAVDSEIVNLRKVFDVLGPLPDHADLFIPVAMSEIDYAAPVDDVAHRYSPVLRGHEADIARFQRIELAAYPAQAEMEARWNDLVAAGSLTGCRPGYDRIEAGISLDLSEDDAIDALCVELSALTGPARVAAPIRASW